MKPQNTTWKKVWSKLFFFWNVTFMLYSLQLLVWRTELHLNLKVDERWRRGGELIKRHYNNDEGPIFLKFLCLYFKKWPEYWSTYNRKKIFVKKIRTRWLLFLMDLVLLSHTKVSNQSFCFTTSWVSSFWRWIWSANTGRYVFHNRGWDTSGTSRHNTELKSCLLRQEGYAM